MAKQILYAPVMCTCSAEWARRRRRKRVRKNMGPAARCRVFQKAMCWTWFGLNVESARSLVNRPQFTRLGVRWILYTSNYHQPSWLITVLDNSPEAPVINPTWLSALYNTTSLTGSTRIYTDVRDPRATSTLVTTPHVDLYSTNLTPSIHFTMSYMRVSPTPWVIKFTSVLHALREIIKKAQLFYLSRWSFSLSSRDAHLGIFK